jgi:hypothetical protein
VASGDVDAKVPVAEPLGRDRAHKKAHSGELEAQGKIVHTTLSAVTGASLPSAMQDAP